MWRALTFESALEHSIIQPNYALIYTRPASTHTYLRMYTSTYVETYFTKQLACATTSYTSSSSYLYERDDYEYFGPSTLISLELSDSGLPLFVLLTVALLSIPLNNVVNGERYFCTLSLALFVEAFEELHRRVLVFRGERLPVIVHGE